MTAKHKNSLNPSNNKTKTHISYVKNAKIEWVLFDENKNNSIEKLDETSINHIEKMVEEGYTSGELCILDTDIETKATYKETEYYGSWEKIEEDELEEIDYFNYSLIPQNMIDSLNKYETEHKETGGFLNAILENNLKETVYKADDNNKKIIPVYIHYIDNNLPAQSWGSKKKVDNWLSNKPKI
jgi:hypothetical protein